MSYLEELVLRGAAFGIVRVSCWAKDKVIVKIPNNVTMINSISMLFLFVLYIEFISTFYQILF